ncbi:MAG: recombinase family protein [Labilithrix sp.]|nr:recombinase family protein [Labilithrix sp.]MBX3218203.1 recombinase family protein [Labilithrix sp.]
MKLQPRSQPLAVVGYVRVSTDQQADEGVSLDAQRERLAASTLRRAPGAAARFSLVVMDGAQSFAASSQCARRPIVITRIGPS